MKIVNKCSNTSSFPFFAVGMEEFTTETSVMADVQTMAGLARASHDMDMFYFVTNVIVDGILCFMGLIGNTLIVIVLQRDGSRTSNSVFLQILAVSDNCYLLYGVTYLVLPSVHLYQGDLKCITQYMDYIITCMMPFAWTALTTSTWMVMVIAVDRYLVVAYPLKATSWCTVARARWVGAFVVTLAIIFNLVRWPRYYFVSFLSNAQTNSTFLSHLKEDIPGWNKDLYRDVYHVSLTYIFIFIIPMTIISIVNLLLIRELHTSTLQRWKMATSASVATKFKEEQQRNSVTHMLVIVITIFLICQLSDFIAAILSSGYFEIHSSTLDYYVGVKESLLILGSTYNFYIYFLFYKRFRHSLVRMCGCIKPNHSPLNVTQLYTIQT